MASLLITPSLVTTTPSGTQTFVPSGGSGSGYVFSFLRNNSGGTINPSTGAYVAGFGGVIDIILLTDSLDNSTSAEVTIIGLSEFQGIGLLPQLASIPAPTLADAGDFLHTDGTNITWEPVSGLLPDQTGHNGEFLSTDGAAASWEAVDALPTQSGHAGAFLTTDGAAASWTFVPPPVSPFDIRNFGAVSAVNIQDPAVAVVDCAPAIYDCIAAATSTIPLFGTLPLPIVYAPTGNWYISRPIVLPIGSNFYGDGKFASKLIIGPGTSSTPSLVQGFSGPMVYLTGLATTAPPQAVFPTYGAPLVGGVGQSMEVGPANPISGPGSQWGQIILHDAYAWSAWLNSRTVTSFSLQMWQKLTTVPGSFFISPIISSKGPIAYADSRGLFDGYDQCFGLYVASQGAGLVFIAALTTVTSGLQFIQSSIVTSPGTYNLEIDYDGAHFDFFVGGVSQGHLAATGAVLRIPWEGTAIGLDGPEYQTLGTMSVVGAVDSIRLSRVARHTGTGSFTPPVAKYTWDSNTMALLNFDQGSIAPVDQPFVMAQAVLPGNTVPSPHYMRMKTFTNPSYDTTVSNMQLICNGTGSGVVCLGASRTLLQGLYIFRPAQNGINLSDGTSFYSNAYDIYVYSCPGIGIQFFGEIKMVNNVGCAISVQLLAGVLDQANDQPDASSFIPYVFGPLDPNYGAVTVKNSNNDEEGNFPIQITAAWVFGQYIASFLSINNAWDTEFQVDSKPAMVYTGIPLGGASHLQDSFYVNADAPCVIHKEGSFVGSTLLVNPNIQLLNVGSIFDHPIIPISNVENWVTVQRPAGITNQTGLTTTDVAARNMAGTFTILHGYTSGGPTFLIPEVDGRFVVSISYLGYVGSAPAAGSTIPGPYVTSANGFVMDQGVDPAGTSQTVWSYTMVRTPGTPLHYEYLPAVPSSFANPLDGETGDFAAGVTIIPASGHVFNFDGGAGFQYILEMGDVLPSDNWWSIGSQYGNLFVSQVDGAQNFTDSFVSDGALYGVSNPGPHNVVIYVENFKYGIIIDGGNQFLGFFNAGVQQPTIYVGQKYDGSQALVNATLRDLKYDRLLSQAITNIQDGGPQAMPLSAFFGDQMTIGWASTGVSAFASRIANSRYGTVYYYLAAYGFPPAYVTDNQLTHPGIATTFWNGWGGTKTLTNMCLMGGFNDILNGVSAADTFASIDGILNGFAATGFFTPPVSISTYPTLNYTAWCVWHPQTAGTATIVINGITFNTPFVTDAQTTATNLANAINANGTLAAIVTASPLLFQGQNVWYTLVQANVGGSAGNGIITTTTTTANGAYWYPADFGPPDIAFGLDATVTINGVEFITNWDTDANTTIANLITRINTSAPTLALVTPTNTGSQLKLTATANGYAGNAITTISNGISHELWTTGGTLTGGADGAIQTGVPNIILCTVPPFGDNPGYTAGKETQRASLNSSISGFVGAGVTIADVDVTLRDPAHHTKILPAYLAADNTNPNAIGHTALFTLLAPLLPGAGAGTPSALSYATNPASYANGGAIASNNPTVTGSVVLWTVSPPLPTGLSISSTTGHVTGTPTVITAAANYTVMATNTHGSITVALNLTIT